MVKLLMKANSRMKCPAIFPLFLAAFLLFSFDSAERKGFTIFLVGDSTMADKPIEGGNPERGWGQMLPAFFPQEAVVENHAMNGRSSKSFIDEGRWAVVAGKLRRGDYVFIQFGHNDQKPDSARHTDPGSTFDANLLRFIRETRQKGATPILFTSIARRQFEADGTLKDTHGAYTEAVKKVAKATDTPLIDLNRLTHDWLQSKGDTLSQTYFTDNTHLNIRGARAVATFAVGEMEQGAGSKAQGAGTNPFPPFRGLGGRFPSFDIVVAKDGSGDFFTLQEAINEVPDYRKESRTRILVRKGTYREKLIVAESKLNVSLIGEDGAVLEYDDHAQKKNAYGENKSTSGSATCYLYADNFYAENITFSNASGPVGQAVAVMVAGDRSVFRRCRFLGFQDTLYTYGTHSRQYYEECYVEGTVDFIFGWSTAVFHRCTIHSKGNGYIAAPATPQGREYGYVFLDCTLTADEGVDNVYLARPWRPFAKAAFIRCYMGKHIAPAGWHNWDKPETEQTIHFAEYGNHGPGARKPSRAPFAKQLENPEKYKIKTILQAPDNWNPPQDPETLILTER